MFEITEELLSNLTGLKNKELKIFYLKYKQSQLIKGNLLTSYVNIEDFKKNILDFLRNYKNL